MTRGRGSDACGLTSVLRSAEVRAFAVRSLPRILLLLVLLAAPLVLRAQTPAAFRQDFDAAWRTVASTYAYLDTKATSWAAIPRLYESDLQQVRTRDEFIGLLERVLDELCDPHAQVNAHLATSPRLVPSGTDLWAVWRNGEAVITDVRAGSDAERAGIRPSEVVESIDTIPSAEAVETRLGRSYAHSVATARDWGLRSVLAGRHNARRLLQLRQGNTVRTVELPARDQFAVQHPQAVTQTRPPGGIGYVRFNDSLGDDSTVQAFDRALGALRDTRGLILDLRNTPSGGNTVIARGVLGRFVSREQPYQRHVLPSQTGTARTQLALVQPRGDFVYQRPVAVLVGHWTGSMGEGLAIGFDATGTGTVVGTEMAGLVGATYQITRPRTGVGLNLPAERLYHVNGTPREAFQPKVLVDITRSGGNAPPDPFIVAALRILAR